jgi:protein phosphatase
VIGLRTAALTDVGLVRANNEDQLIVAAPLYAIADGMGGAAAGEVAADTAIRTLHEVFTAAGPPSPEALRQATQAANRAVWEQAEANPEMHGMGTTLVAVARITDDELAVVNVGDSRLYRFRDGDLEQVTEDHNLVSELVAEGRLSKEEAEFHPRRNIVTRVLGVDPEVPVDLFAVTARPGDRYLLCSDGLSDWVSDDMTASLLRRLADPQEAASELVEEAKRRGGNDNITVLLIDVFDQDGAEEATASIPAVTRGSDGIGTAAGGTTAVPLEGADPAITSTPIPTTPGKVDETRAARRKRRRRRHKADIQGRSRARVITVRVVLFLALLLVVIGGGAAGLGWYARDGYFVGLKGTELTIYQGQPGGLLWFHPTVADATGVNLEQIEPRHLPALQAGQQESSISTAKQYVTNLVDEELQAEAAAAPPTPSPTTTTTVPSGSGKHKSTPPTTAK